MQPDALDPPTLRLQCWPPIDRKQLDLSVSGSATLGFVPIVSSTLLALSRVTCSPRMSNRYRDPGVAAVTVPDLLSAFSYEISAEYSCRAHIVGQRSTRLHVRAHVAMLRVARRRGDRRELGGQLGRIIAAALFSRIGVPEGNTGGANVSALKRMPVPDDLKHIIEQVR